VIFRFGNFASGRRSLTRLREHLICFVVALGSRYRDFWPVSENEVAAVLAGARREGPPQRPWQIPTPTTRDEFLS
jgi:hypothetical protein